MTSAPPLFCLWYEFHRKSSAWQVVYPPMAVGHSQWQASAGARWEHVWEWVCDCGNLHVDVQEAGVAEGDEWVKMEFGAFSLKPQLIKLKHGNISDWICFFLDRITWKGCLHAWKCSVDAAWRASGNHIVRALLSSQNHSIMDNCSNPWRISALLLKDWALHYRGG